eukprot:CAMPEP_0175870540 /NCGR_PEP_ID=MMETSP0107_2-20121207/36620_1 /TAXON_ID=195067 ORGANISM="Goniomonas pacifica, Strain CCMP1869" /NCGR_SAMPLE_ID=MMETSP0107_2 /ASSEMBLY_ACC=CAM_ASM_000203 /LENGTH=50 /DNA_ID=CAMNT_0017188787 /DNA_START=42 /DNA_END=190 /DNA_ORIENTATION=-
MSPSPDTTLPQPLVQPHMLDNEDIVTCSGGLEGIFNLLVDIKIGPRVFLT